MDSDAVESRARGRTGARVPPGRLGWRVWISGASTGIGAALAGELIARGCDVALFARTESRLAQLQAELCSRSPESRVIYQAGDVSDRQSVRAAIDATVREFGGVDAVILNAGIGDMMLPDDFDAEVVERITMVNYLGAIYGIEAVLPEMLRRRSGIIAGVSSIGAVRGFPISAPYCASKAALTSFLESLRNDLYGRGVQVTIVSPGFVKTPLTDRNHFPMPFRQTPETAARIIVNGIAGGKREVHFPKRLTIPLKLLRCMPGVLFDALMRRFVVGRRYHKTANGESE